MDVLLTDPLLHLTEVSLVSGPLELPKPAYSFADDWELQLYTPDEIAEAILAVPGVSLKHRPAPTWESWAAAWREADRYIDFDLVACDIDPDNAWPNDEGTIAPAAHRFWSFCRNT